MTALLDRLVDLIQAWIAYLVPWTILGDDECGLVRRLGKYHRNLAHGWNWKIPLFEAALTETAALDSTMLREQSLTTADGIAVTLRGVLAYRVVNPRLYILDCATAQSVVNDVGCCIISQVIPTLTADVVLKGDDFDRQLLRKMRVRAKKWGIDVESFGLADRVRARTYRLITSRDSEHGDGVS